ncbi:hypothetical protein MHM39_15025 [Phaeobacter sp. CNT1-3]|nr:hypothetical protein [Phaeobacter sp. CNT1-3]
MNAPTKPTDMATDATATIGHNNPPAFDPTVLAEFQTTANDFLEATAAWQALEKIENEAQAEQLNDQITGLRGLWKKVDAARKDAKKPHDDAGKAVQAAFTPLLKKLAMASDALKPKLADYVAAREAEEAQRKAAEEARARADREAAEERARLAQMQGDIDAQVEAEEAQKAAEKAEREAAKGASTKVKSASGGGRTMSTRTIREVEVTNVRVLFMHYQNHPDVADVLRRLAAADVRAKGFNPEQTPIPGIKITERKNIA